MTKSKVSKAQNDLPLRAQHRHHHPSIKSTAASLHQEHSSTESDSSCNRTWGEDSLCSRAEYHIDHTHIESSPDAAPCKPLSGMEWDVICSHCSNASLSIVICCLRMIHSCLTRLRNNGVRILCTQEQSTILTTLTLNHLQMLPPANHSLAWSGM